MERTNSGVTTAGVFLNPGNVTMKTTVKMVLTKKTACTDLVLQVNSLVPTSVVYPWLKSAMVSTIARTMLPAMRRTNGVREIPLVHQIILSAKRQTFALNHIGCVTVTTIAVTTAMKIHCTVHREPVPRIASDVQTIAVFQQHGQ